MIDRGGKTEDREDPFEPGPVIDIKNAFPEKVRESAEIREAPENHSKWPISSLFITFIK